MPPREWYRHGIRLLGRTAVECTRDALGDRIGLDVASVAVRMPSNQLVVIDPFAGSCNTLFWILRFKPFLPFFEQPTDPTQECSDTDKRKRNGFMDHARLRSEGMPPTTACLTIRPA